MKKPKSKSSPSQTPKAPGKAVRDVSLLKFTRKCYYEYGVATLEDRAVPDYRDGMKPVHRRVLWAAHKLGIHSGSKHVKSARVVGETIGKFHPHADTGIYDTMVGLTNHNAIVPYFEGDGNWGSLSGQNAAAMRYTEARLSKFSDQVLFNKFYLPVVDMVPNFDGSDVEPLIIPSLLPVVLLNGSFGIAVGATTYLPSVEYKTVLKALRAVYEGEELTPKFLSRTLRFRTLYGGTEVDPKSLEGEDKAFRFNLFKTPKGRVQFESDCAYDEKTRTFRITKFARQQELSSVIEKLTEKHGSLIQTARDLSGTKDKYGTLEIVLKKTLTTKDYARAQRIIPEELKSRSNLVLNYTERYIDDIGQGQARVTSMGLTQMLTRWIEWRTELERKACAYWIAQADKEIRRLELLMMAVDNRKAIIESLDRDDDTEALYAWLAKRLNITRDEASFIYSLKVIQLRKLERKALELQMKEVKARKAELNGRKSKPLPFMAKQLEEFVKLGA